MAYLGHPQAAWKEKGWELACPGYPWSPPGSSLQTLWNLPWLTLEDPPLQSCMEGAEMKKNWPASEPLVSPGLSIRRPAVSSALAPWSTPGSSLQKLWPVASLATLHLSIHMKELFGALGAQELHLAVGKVDWSLENQNQTKAPQVHHSMRVTIWCLLWVLPQNYIRWAAKNNAKKENKIEHRPELSKNLLKTGVSLLLPCKK